MRSFCSAYIGAPVRNFPRHFVWSIFFFFCIAPLVNCTQDQTKELNQIISGWVCKKHLFLIKGNENTEFAASIGNKYALFNFQGFYGNLKSFYLYEDDSLEFTPMHKTLRVQLPDLRYTDARVNFSVKSFRYGLAHGTYIRW